jgi:glucokinase
MAEPAAPLPWLVADVGGTHARFAWVDAADALPRHVQVLATRDHAGPLAAARAYLAGLPAQGLAAAPRAAAFALAGPVQGDAPALTNAGWVFDRAALAAGLGVERLLLLNDFEALALALPALHAGQLHGEVRWPPPAGVRAVVGPGTGLGVATLVPTAAGWQALAGEGGHATLAAADDFEQAVLAQARRAHAHVSAERLLAGSGLPLLHQAVAAVDGVTVPAVDAPTLLALARDAGDARALRTLDVFFALLGGFAGNLALTVGARGGVYIGGGLVPRVAGLWARSRFRGRFEAKGRFEAWLRAIPTYLITDAQAALPGVARALAGAAAVRA